ncbi:MAG: hypothetical protein Q8R67_18375 [Rhodoferax sp.]|nr:hypothetical protein [Rhodoferax sp.]MDP3653641.1 hypothetical protein [Rhodoferax sp.]
MNRLIWMAGFVVAAAITGVSCDKVKSPEPEISTPDTATNPMDKTASERKAFTQAAQKELDELRIAVANLRTKAEAASQESKAKLRQQVERLELELRQTQQRLAELGTASAQTWSQLKEAFTQSLEKLKTEIDNKRKNSPEN